MVSKLLSRLSPKPLPPDAPGLRYERFQVARPADWGFVDSLEVDPCGIIRVIGWSTETVADHNGPKISIDQIPIALLQKFRTARPDLAGRSPLPHAGLTFEYLVPEFLRNRGLTIIAMSAPGLSSFEAHGNFSFITAHYGSLFDLEEVLHREHIYGSGPPNAVASPEVIQLAEMLEGRILDFGCGSGALVRHLRSIGREASGLELDGPVIRDHLKQEVSEFVTLYDGNFPSPYPSKSFDCVFCSEVLEHIPDFEQAVKEMARLAAGKALLTVPDMSAIPVGFRHRLVPWHLLEATHVNFFTQKGLGSLLRRHFKRVEFGRISLSAVNDSPYYVSLVAFCEI